MDQGYHEGHEAHQPLQEEHRQHIGDGGSACGADWRVSKHGLHAVHGEPRAFRSGRTSGRSDDGKACDGTAFPWGAFFVVEFYGGVLFFGKYPHQDDRRDDHQGNFCQCIAYRTILAVKKISHRVNDIGFKRRNYKFFPIL